MSDFIPWFTLSLFSNYELFSRPRLPFNNGRFWFEQTYGKPLADDPVIRYDECNPDDRGDEPCKSSKPLS